MRRNTYYMALWLSLVASACCAPCERENLGDYPLQARTLTWLSFADGEQLRFRSSDGQVRLFSYTPLQEADEQLLDNCDDTDNCGLCCNTFQAGTAYTRLMSEDGRLIWDIIANKDFVNASINDGLGRYEDFLTINFNDALSCEVFGIPDTTFGRSVTLNGRTFSGVMACEVAPGASSPDRSGVVGYYFQPEVGIVGFVDEDGVSWRVD
jgi:hypothetical protein